MSPRRSLSARAATIVLGVAVLGSGALAAEKPATKKVLYVTRTGGFHHSACEYSIPVFKRMAEAVGFLDVTCTDKTDLLNAEALRGFDAVVFSNTSGSREQFGLSEKDAQALVDWVKGGKAFVGVHAATDCMADFAPYVEMIGGSFNGHPWTKKIKIDVDDPGHPTAVFLPSPWWVDDEIYTFKSWSRAKTNVILSMDVGPEENKGNRDDRDYALAWSHPFGEGRVFFTALGHKHEVWDDPLFKKHLMAGLLWAFKMAPQDILLAVDPDVQVDDQQRTAEGKDGRLPYPKDYPLTLGNRKPGEWTKVFDGKTLEIGEGKAWVTTDDMAVSAKHWTVQPGGILQGDSQGSREGASHLYHVGKMYRNFEYRAEVCISAEGNSGMYFRCSPGNKVDGRWKNWPDGYEAQVNNGWDPDARRSGSFYPEPSVREEDLARYLGYDKAKDDGNLWFTQHVIAVDDHIVVKLNGKVVADGYRKGYSEGYFAFQMHHHGTVVKFRNIEVRELP